MLQKTYKGVEGHSQLWFIDIWVKNGGEKKQSNFFLSRHRFDKQTGPPPKTVENKWEQWQLPTSRKCIRFSTLKQREKLFKSYICLYIFIIFQTWWNNGGKENLWKGPSKILLKDISGHKRQGVQRLNSYSNKNLFQKKKKHLSHSKWRL